MADSNSISFYAAERTYLPNGPILDTWTPQRDTRETFTATAADAAASTLFECVLTGNGHKRKSILCAATAAEAGRIYSIEWCQHLHVQLIILFSVIVCSMLCDSYAAHRQWHGTGMYWRSIYNLLFYDSHFMTEQTGCVCVCTERIKRSNGSIKLWSVQWVWKVFRMHSTVCRFYYVSARPTPTKRQHGSSSQTPFRILSVKAPGGTSEIVYFAMEQWGNIISTSTSYKNAF